MCRFFGGDSALDVLFQAELVKLSSCDVVGVRDGDVWRGAEDVELALDDTRRLSIRQRE